MCFICRCDLCGKAQQCAYMAVHTAADYDRATVVHQSRWHVQKASSAVGSVPETVLRSTCRNKQAISCMGTAVVCCPTRTVFYEADGAPLALGLAVVIGQVRRGGHGILEEVQHRLRVHERLAARTHPVAGSAGEVCRARMAFAVRFRVQGSGLGLRAQGQGQGQVGSGSDVHSGRHGAMTSNNHAEPSQRRFVQRPKRTRSCINVNRSGAERASKQAAIAGHNLNCGCRDARMRAHMWAGCRVLALRDSAICIAPPATCARNFSVASAAAGSTLVQVGAHA